MTGARAIEITVAAVERNNHPDPGKPLTLQEADLLLAAEQVKALRDPEAVPGSFGFRDRP